MNNENRRTIKRPTVQYLNMEINRGKGNKIVGGGGRGSRGGRRFRGNAARTSPINLHPSSNSAPMYKENQVPAHQNQQRFKQEPFNGPDYGDRQQPFPAHPDQSHLYQAHPQPFQNAAPRGARGQQVGRRHNVSNLNTGRGLQTGNFPRGLFQNVIQNSSQNLPHGNFIPNIHQPPPGPYNQHETPISPEEGFIRKNQRREIPHNKNMHRGNQRPFKPGMHLTHRQIHEQYSQSINVGMPRESSWNSETYRPTRHSRGRGRTRGNGTFVNVDESGNQRPISRSSSCSNEPSNNFDDINLPTTSGTKYESRYFFSSRINNSRGRRQGIGDKGPLAELSCDHYASGYFDTREYPCAEPVEVEVPFCHHKVAIPCHTRFYPKCNLPCDKRLDCGHRCEQICHEHNDPEHLDYGCVKPCARLNKGCSSDHKCLLCCFEECKPCTEMVTKKVVDCGHTMEVACSTVATRQMCEGRCSNKLSCGHQCGKRCMDTCNSNDCRQPVKVEKPMFCGHTEAHVPCNKVSHIPDMTPETLMQYCTEPCGKELTCTHTCSGTCSECMQGRIHKLCNEQCGNVLICGHSCKVPCGEVCPPCKEPCMHKCKHSKCNRECGEECVPCKEPCDYACPHMQCSRRCGEICDRDPCYELCPHRLSCGHSCAGFCGEPCPPCRKCKPEHFEEIFFLGEETEEDSKWVQMVDCGHTVESTGLEMWLEMDQDSGEIGCKVCPHPQCKTPIIKVLRFRKQTCMDIQSVKAKCIEKRDEIKAESTKASRKIQGVVYTLMDTDNERVDQLKRMFRELNMELHKVKGETQRRNTFRNGIQERKTDTRKLAVLCFWTEFFMSVYKRKKEAWPRLNEESKSLLNSKINFLTRYLMKRRQTISKQEMEGFECEVKRVHRIIDLFLYTSSLRYRMAGTAARPFKQVAERLIFSINAYDKELDDKVKAMLKILKEQIKSATELTDEERYVINKASYLSFHSAQKSGYWFKCKKGHLCSITECRGAMEEGVCPITGCGDRIGGYNRR